MDWLQEGARVLSKDRKPIYWSVPTGFIVKQKYLKPIVKEIRTIINGKVASLYSAH